MSEQAAQTPLIELARSVPKDLRADWPFQWHEDGTACGLSTAPVGEYLHGLADQVERLTAEVNDLKHRSHHYLLMLAEMGVDIQAAKDSECYLGDECDFVSGRDEDTDDE